MTKKKKMTRTTFRSNNYKSKFEEKFGSHCESLVEKGRLKNFEYETEHLEYWLSHLYLPDFILEGANGKKIYIETKGYFKSKDRTKAKKVREQHPDKDIRFVFQNSRNKLNKKSKTTYGMWCIKHGFKFADERIPREWLKELK